jgi:hypothetical protein
LGLLFAIYIFVDHRASGVVDFPAPGDPMLSFGEKRLVFYSGHGAAIMAANITVTLLVAALLTLYWISGREGSRVQRIRKCCEMSLCSALLIWLPIYLLLPKIPVVVQMRPAGRNMLLHHSIPSYLEEEAGGKGTNFTPDIAWVRMQLRDTSDFRRNINPKFQTNFFSGQPWCEEDSPGNYTVRQTAGGIEYIWYDIEGGEHAVPLFHKKE